MLFRTTTFAPYELLMRSHSRVAVAAAIAVALVTGSVPAAYGQNKGQPASREAGSASTWVIPDAGCTWEWPYRQDVSSLDPVEIKHNAKLALCATAGTNQTIDLWDERVWINTSPAVWWFDTADVDSFVVQDDDSRSARFRASVHPGYSYIAPGETVSYPIAPGTLEWHIDKDLTAAWVANDIYSKLAKAGLKGITSATLKKLANKAVATCTGTFLNEVEFAQEMTEAEAVDNVLSTVGAVADTKACATAWTDAEVAIKKFPTVADDVAKAGQVAGNASKVKLIWGWVQSGCALVPKAPC